MVLKQHSRSRYPSDPDQGPTRHTGNQGTWVYYRVRMATEYCSWSRAEYSTCYTLHDHEFLQGLVICLHESSNKDKYGAAPSGCCGWTRTKEPRPHLEKKKERAYDTSKKKERLSYLYSLHSFTKVTTAMPRLSVSYRTTFIWTISVTPNNLSSPLCNAQAIRNLR